jgi:uncharacterized protein YndB with AHSA1/START domain
METYVQRYFRTAPEGVWPLVDDPAVISRWFAYADRAEVLEGSGEGRRQRMHGLWGRRHFEVDQKVVAYVPARRIAWEHEAERLDGKPAPRFARYTRFEVRLEPQDGGTLVTLLSVQLPAGFLKGIVMNRAGRRETMRQLEKSIDDLERLAYRT